MLEICANAYVHRLIEIRGIKKDPRKIHRDSTQLYTDADRRPTRTRFVFVVFKQLIHGCVSRSESDEIPVSKFQPDSDVILGEVYPIVLDIDQEPHVQGLQFRIRSWQRHRVDCAIL